MPTVYVVAEEPGERQEIAALLAAENNPVAEFRDISAFLAQADYDSAGCVVADLHPAAGKVMSQLRAAQESLPIVVVSECVNVALAVQAMKEGAADFIEKPIVGERLLASVGAALELSRTLVERARRKRELMARYRTLSVRERDVIDAVLEGRANREVAAQLGISSRTVETHRSNAMTKMGARTLPDLVRIWLDLDVGAR